MKDLTTIPQEEIDGTFSPEVPHGDIAPPYQNNTNMIDAEDNYNDMRHRASDIMDPICELSQSAIENETTQSPPPENHDKDDSRTVIQKQLSFVENYYVNAYNEQSNA